ncbi:MAG TPA: hypothetical protein VM865_03765 [Acidobacteriaceae bacterium]|nr:hypothetical protein [Acidobacteriaceae bacterium]
MRPASFSAALGLGFALSLAPASSAQTGAPTPPPKPLPGSIAAHPDWPRGNPADVQTIDGLMAALYDVISGPAGKPRDWDRFRSLFLPDGRLGVIRPQREAANGQPARPADAVFLTPQDYIDRDDPFFKANGFFERGIANRVEEFGNLVSVWSTYESRHAASEPPFTRGINSLQLVHAEGRFWIASILWDDERSGVILPEKYLGK